MRPSARLERAPEHAHLSARRGALALASLVRAVVRGAAPRACLHSDELFAPPFWPPVRPERASTYACVLALGATRACSRSSVAPGGAVSPAWVPRAPLERASGGEMLPEYLFPSVALARSTRLARLPRSPGWPPAWCAAADTVVSAASAVILTTVRLAHNERGCFRNERGGTREVREWKTREGRRQGLLGGQPGEKLRGSRGDRCPEHGGGSPCVTCVT